MSEKATRGAALISEAEIERLRRRGGLLEYFCAHCRRLLFEFKFRGTLLELPIRCRRCREWNILMLTSDSTT